MICKVITLGKKIYFCWLTELPVVGIDERTSLVPEDGNDTPKYRFQQNTVW